MCWTVTRTYTLTTRVGWPQHNDAYLIFNRKNRTLDFLVWVFKKWWFLQISNKTKTRLPIKRFPKIYNCSYRKWYFPSFSWIILIEISFSFEISVPQNCTLTFEYHSEFSKKFEINFLLFLGALEKWFMKKKLKQKISWHCPFNVCLYVRKMEHRWLHVCARPFPELWGLRDARPLLHLSWGHQGWYMCLYLDFKSNTIPWDLS
jgi:hypothetical protein